MRIVFTCIFLLLCFGDVNGQIFSELNGGVNYTNVFERFSPLQLYNFDSDFDWKTGIGIGIRIRDKWILKSGVYASLRTSKSDYLFGPPGFKTRSTFSFYEIPVIYYRNFFTKNLYFGGGLVNCIQESPSIHLIDEKSFQVDVSLNARYYFTNRLNVELSYQLGDIFSLFNTQRSRFLFSTGNFSINYSFINIKSKFTR